MQNKRTDRTIVISINTTWNIVTFRTGLICALRDAGYEIVAISPRDAFCSRFQALGVRHVHLTMDRQGVSPIKDTLLFLRYLNILREVKPAAFLGYTPKPNVYGSLASHVLGIPVISNISGLGTAFIRRGLITRIVKMLYRRALGRAKTVFFQNPDDMALFIDEGIVSRDKAKLLAGSGVDLDSFAAHPQPTPDTPFTFLMVGRLLWDKGVGEYAAAARIVKAACPDVRFQLLGFLDVPNRTAVPRSDVEQWVGEGILDYLGDTDDVRPFIRAASCVVLPSYREGLPKTLIEAGAIGRPMIATDVPGCRHIVEHEVNGYLCRVRDADSLADAMLRMIELTYARRSEMGNAARKRVEEEFDERFTISHYLRALTELGD